MLLLMVTNMNKNAFWNHIGKYFNAYIGFAILLIVGNMVVYNIIRGYNESKQEGRYSLESVINDAYKIDPSILNFDDNNTAILKMDTLLLGVSNGKDSLQLASSSYTEDFDECVGYIIVKRDENSTKFIIDESHICDMIDY